MLNKLFRDPGTKVASYAKIVFIVVLVLYGILLIASVFAGFFLFALVFGLISVALAYIGCLMIMTFGEMAQATIENRHVNARILEELKKLSAPLVQPPAPAGKAANGKEENADAKKPEAVKENKAEPAQPVMASAASKEHKKDERVQEKKPETVAPKSDLQEALAYALRFSTDEGMRRYIETKRSQTNDLKEAAVYDAILLNADDRLRVVIEMYLAEE